jgi:ribosomal protein S18 acetylase RimI-like enzyme
MNSLLDNPAWSALTTVQAAFAVGGEDAKRYRKGVLPFAALEPGAPAAHLDPLMDAGESFYLIGELPKLPANWTLELELPCAQLLAPEEIGDVPAMTEEIVYLGEQDKIEMFELINRVQPGYYLPDTRQLGCYFGIRVGGRLVAMAGERMRMTGLSEISAVCTLPEFTGRGYAQQLMTRVIQEIKNAGIAPYLHVSRANARALRLYELLGFRYRRDISFWRIKKISD